MSDSPENTMPSPERLLPSDIFRGETPKVLQAEKKHLEPHERYKLHQEELIKAPSLEDVLRKELKDEGKEPPTTVNLTLRAIEGFQRTVREAQDFRRVVRESRDPMDKSAAAVMYARKKEEVDDYKKYGLSFEKAYRDYLSSRNEFTHFLIAQDQIIQLDTMLGEPSFQSLPEDSNLDEKAQSRIERSMRSASFRVHQDQFPEIEATIEALKSVYGEGSPEYQEMRKTLLVGTHSEKPQTKGEMLGELQDLRQQVQELWQDPMVRRFWQEREFDKLMVDFASGEDVIEMQSVIKNLNRMHEWEIQHQRTTIGGILVGPPGVGKTTLVRHYLEEKDRHFAYIDLSEDVTRYLLYGSKAVELKSPTEHFEQLATQIKMMEADDFQNFVTKNAESLQKTANLSGEEAVAVLIDQVVEQLQAGVDQNPELKSLMRDAHDKLVTLAKGAYHKELSTQFSHVVKKNGWRDGIIIAALRRGDSVILDEFNKNKNWSLIYGLLTAKPGEKWYFADNDEEIEIPLHWRMYFTANIGRKHGVFPVAEALASRAGGKVMEQDYPPTKEEMMVALVSLANAEGDFLRSKDDLAKLYVLLYNVFPGVRTAIEDKPQSIPISFRTIRDLGEKLVQYKDPKTGRLVYNPSDKTFDQGLYEVLVDPYKLYEDKTIPREIVRLATSAGLMLDDSIKDQVVGWIGAEEYDRRKKAAEEHKEDFDVIVRKIRGEMQDVSNLAMPTTAKY